MPRKYDCSNCHYGRHNTLRIYIRTTDPVKDYVKRYDGSTVYGQVGTRRYFKAIGVFCRWCKAFTLTANIEDIIQNSIWADSFFGGWPIYYREIAWVDDSIRPVKIRGEGYHFKRFATYYRRTGLFLLDKMAIDRFKKGLATMFVKPNDWCVY